MCEVERFVFPVNDMKITMLILQNVSQQLDDFCSDYNIQDSDAQKKIKDLRSLVDYSSKVIEPSYETFFDFLTELSKDIGDQLLDVSKMGSSYYAEIEYTTDDDDDDGYSFGDLLSSILESDKGKDKDKEK